MASLGALLQDLNSQNSLLYCFLSPTGCVRVYNGGGGGVISLTVAAAAVADVPLTVRCMCPVQKLRMNKQLSFDF